MHLVRAASPDSPDAHVEAIYQANLAALPRLVRAAVESADPVGIRLDTAGAPASAMVLTPSGRWARIHQSDDPMAASEAMRAAFPGGQFPPLLVVIGLGLGFLLDAIERHSPTTRVLALEPTPVMPRAMLERRDWTGWLASGRLTLLVGPDYPGVQDAWRLIPPGLTPPIIATPLLEREFPVEVADAKARAARVVQGARDNDEARRRFAGRYLLNTLANVPAIAAGGDVASLDGLFRDVPTVVVGAGPSLDRNIADLRRLEGRVIIVAVDTAVRPLLSAGLHPHFVVAVDPSELNARHLTDLPDTRGMWLVAEASIDQALFPQFAGRTFTFKVANHHPWPWLHSHGLGRGTLLAWGSVLTTAFDFARRLGGNPLVFAGSDLAYTDGVLYCRNTVYEPEWQHLDSPEALEDEFREYLATQPHLTEPDVAGGEVLTAPRFLQFRDWLVGQSMESSGRRILNATGRGILQGGRISNVGFPSLSFPHIDGGHEAIQAAIYGAWRSTADARATAVASLRAALASDPPDAPTGDWLDFGGDTATMTQVEERLEAAASGLATLSGVETYLAMARDYYDARVVSLERAKFVIHADYDHASVQANAHQAHVLIDFIQRTYGIAGDASVRDVLTAAGRLRPGVRALDFGCGLGRSMEPLARAGIRVDGVDICPAMLDLAKQNPRLAQSQFFDTPGNDCGAAPDGTYDLVYSHLCLQHVPSRTIRNEILDAFARALRPGGVVLVQLHVYPDRTAATVSQPHRPWRDDYFEAASTNGEVDAWVTPDELPLVYADFARRFHDVRLQFVDFPRDLTTLYTDAANTWFSHLIVSATAGYGLGARVYAPMRKA